MVVLIVVAQFSFGANSYAAAGEAALNMDGYFSYGGKGGLINVCNDGDEAVQSFTLVNDTVGATVSDTLVTADAQKTPPTTPGVIQLNGNWVGLLEIGQCVTIATLLENTVAIGESTTPTFHVENSVLQGGAPNPYQGIVSHSYGTFLNSLPPDIAITPRLTTKGTIQNGTNVVYEVTIANIGDGAYPVAENLSFAMLIPTAANYSQVTTVPAKSDVGIVINFCQNLGVPSNVSPNLAAYSGSVAYCNINITDDLNPGEKIVLNFEMQATAEFTSGSFFARVFIIGYDVDSLRFQAALIRPGDDPFALDINNIAALEYNNDVLQTTVNRCPGQGATTTDGTGCFTVSFNKKIYAPEFTSDDLLLNGGGKIETFTQIDDFTWQVTISGITPNSILSLTLGEGGVQDYNAVVNGAQVLGENTIRYELPYEVAALNSNNVTAASGLLAETGNNEDLSAPILLLLFGSGLLFLSHKNRNAMLRNLMRI